MCLTYANVLFLLFRFMDSNMKLKSKITLIKLSAISTAIFLTACASPIVVQSMKPGDTGLTCGQLQNEYADANRYKETAEQEKTVTGNNVLRALFFWPAILGTASNANEAIAAADSRKVHLANQMARKNCKIPLLVK